MKAGARPGPALLLVAAASAAIVGEASAAARLPAAAAGVPSSLVVAQVPHDALAPEALAGGTYRELPGEGGRLVLVSPDGATRVLTRAFASAADPEVSFDGKRLLFAAKKLKDDPWCVFEMELPGGEARRITCGAAGARQPVYQSTIYTITPTNVEPWVQVAFVGVNPGERNEASVAPNTSLWTVKTDGTALRRITYNLSNDMDPVMLPDGRLLYASWLRHTSREDAGRVALVAVNGDGTDAQVYAGGGLRVKQTPAPTAGGLLVFAEADRVTGDGSGRLAAVERTRPLHTHRAMTSASDGFFRAPAPLPDGRVLVAWRPAAPAGAPAAAQQAGFGIHRFDPATGVREELFDDPAWHDVQAKLVAPRAVPDARSSVVREDDKEGKLFAIDVGIHDLGPRLPRGEARSLRVVEGVPASATAPAGRRLLGTIPVHEDGSFQVQIPANTPVQLQLLDEDGLAVRGSAWVWVRNHAAQGCVGCHEDAERTPPNRFVQALQAPAPVLNQPAEKRRSVTYADVKPVVESKCMTCHAEGGQPPRLGGERGGLGPYVAAGEARRSRLVWHLLGRNTARPWDAEAGATAPAPMPMQAEGLSRDEVRAFVEWIDLGGQP